MPLRAAPLVLELEDRLKLEDLLRSGRTPERLRQRCRILLMGAEGHANAAIASELKIARSTVLKWRRRFRRERLSAFGTFPRTDRRDPRASRLQALLNTPPPQGAAFWTIRALAEAAGLSPATVQRRLAAEGLAPNPRRSRLSPVDRLEGLVGLRGLYVHVPYHAVVLEVDPSRRGRPSGGMDAPPEPGEPAWGLHLHLRALEGLRRLEGCTPHYSFHFWEFLAGLRPSREGHQLWCLMDAPVPEAFLRQLEAERPDLRFTHMEPGRAWLHAMRAKILPALHRCGEAALGDPSHALAAFLEGGAPDPFQWRS